MESPIDISKIIFPKTVMVTGQEIDISVLTERQQVLYLNLFLEMIEMYTTKGKTRTIIGLVGPTGAGKSVISALFLEFARQLNLPFRLATLGIDAFHYPNEVLLAKERDGKNLKEWKGAPDTYDVPKLEQELTDFLQGKEMSFPEYSRETHDPIEHVFDVREEKVLLILEGLWVLYDKDGWEKIGTLIDASIFIQADLDQVKNTVVVRHMRGGRSEEDANTYYDTVDAKNYTLVMATKGKAQKVIETYHGI